jgi:hypothetical protein
MTTTSSEPSSRPGGEIIARAGSYYRNTRYIIAAVVFFMGLWFIRDGYFKWPKENEEARAAGKSIMPHPGWDIPSNKILGVVLPPLAVLLLARWLYISRGEYRLSGQTLHVPGHPPVPFEMITAIDKRQWDRKGIAYIDYEVNGAHGRLKLDDFIYEREPTDQIYDAIVKFVQPADEQGATSPAVMSENQEQTKSPET